MKWLTCLCIFTWISSGVGHAQSLKIIPQNGHQDAVHLLALSDDGKYLYSAENSLWCAWDLNTRKLLHKTPAKFNTILDINPLGSLVQVVQGNAVPGVNRSLDSVVYAAQFSGRAVKTFGPGVELLGDLSDNGKGYWLLSMDQFDDQKTRNTWTRNSALIFFKNGQQRQIAVPGFGGILDFRTNADFSLAGVLSKNSGLCLYDTSGKIVFSRYERGFGDEYPHCFYIDEERCYLFVKDAQFRPRLEVWNYKTNKQLGTLQLKSANDFKQGFTFDTKNARFWLIDDFKIHEYSAVPGLPLTKSHESMFFPHSLLFDSHRRGLWVAGSTGGTEQICFFDPASGLLSAGFVQQYNSSLLQETGFLADGRFFTCSPDLKIFGNDLLSPGEINFSHNREFGAGSYSFPFYNSKLFYLDPVNQLLFMEQVRGSQDFSPDSVHILSCDEWGNKQYIMGFSTYGRPDSFPELLGYLPGPRLFLFKKAGNVLEIRNGNGKQVKRFPVYPYSGTETVNFDSKGDYLAFRDGAGDLVVYEVKSWKKIYAHANTGQHKTVKCRLYPEESLAMIHIADTYGSGGEMWMLDLDTKKATKNQEFNMVLEDIRLVPSAKLMVMAASSGDSGTLILLDYEKNVVRSIYRYRGAVQQVSSAADGSYLCTRHLNGDIYFWKPGLPGWQLYYLQQGTGAHGWLSNNGFYTVTAGLSTGLLFNYRHSFVGPHTLDMLLNRPDMIQQQWIFPDQVLQKVIRESVKKRSLREFGKADYLLDVDPDSLERYVDFSSLEWKDIPPVQANARDISLEWKTMDASSPGALLFEISVNGVPVKKGSGLYKSVIPLNDGQNRIRIQAKRGNKYLLPLETVIDNAHPDSVRLIYIGIGVSSYKDSTLNLPYAAKDIRDMANVVGCIKYNPDCPSRYQGWGGYHYSRVWVDTLLNEAVNKQGIAALKKRLAAQVRPNDVLIIHYAGHGVLDSRQDFYLAAHDMEFDRPALNGISYSLLEDLLKEGPLNRLVLIDACHSGLVDEDMETPVTQRPDTIRLTAHRVKRGVGVEETQEAAVQGSFELMQLFFQQVDRETGAGIIAATAGNSYALESPQWQNGAFTYAVIQGLLKMEADEDKDGKIRVEELKRYLQYQVPALTDFRQKPAMRAENPENDFRLW